METLNSPVGIGAWALRNRIVMAPLTRCRAGAGRVPGAAMVEYYRQRAGAGLIVSEATAISPQAVGYPDTPGIWTEAQVEGWKAVTRAVHEAGVFSSCNCGMSGASRIPFTSTGLPL